jgi:hypothetical protein
MFFLKMLLAVARIGHAKQTTPYEFRNIGVVSLA